MFLKLYCSHPSKTLGVTYNTMPVSTMLITQTFHKKIVPVVAGLFYISCTYYTAGKWTRKNVKGCSRGPISMTSVSQKNWEKPHNKHVTTASFCTKYHPKKSTFKAGELATTPHLCIVTQNYRKCRSKLPTLEK